MFVSAAFGSDLTSAAVVGSDENATVSKGAFCTAIANSLAAVGDDSLTTFEANSAAGDVSATIEDDSGEDSAGTFDGAASDTAKVDGVVVSMTEMFKA